VDKSNRRRIAEENAHQLRKLAITLHGDRAVEEHYNADLARRYARLAREHDELRGKYEESKREHDQRRDEEARDNDNTTRLLHSLRRIVADGAINTGARIGELDRSTQARLDRLSREVGGIAGIDRSVNLALELLAEITLHARAIRGHLGMEAERRDAPSPQDLQRLTKRKDQQ
jgi:hypothetical protein